MWWVHLGPFIVGRKGAGWCGMHFDESGLMLSGSWARVRTAKIKWKWCESLTAAHTLNDTTKWPHTKNLSAIMKKLDPIKLLERFHSCLISSRLWFLLGLHGWMAGWLPNLIAYLDHYTKVMPCPGSIRPSPLHIALFLVFLMKMGFLATTFSQLFVF